MRVRSERISGVVERTNVVVRGVRPAAMLTQIDRPKIAPNVTPRAPTAESATAPANASSASPRAAKTRGRCARPGSSASERIVTPAEQAPTRNGATSAAGSIVPASQSGTIPTAAFAARTPNIASGPNTGERFATTS